MNRRYLPRVFGERIQLIDFVTADSDVARQAILACLDELFPHLFTTAFFRRTWISTSWT
jgi:hypothetical protein